jgi:hypothetical protein
MASPIPTLRSLSIALLMAMPPVALAAQDAHTRCGGSETAGSTTPTPADPYPLMAAGWGPELGNGRMASRWAEDWTGMASDQRAPGMKALALGNGASLTVSAELRLREVSTQNGGLVAGADKEQAQLRAVLGADLRLSPRLRFYGEVGTGQVDGGRVTAAANFQNRLALQQLFADVRGMHGKLLFGAMLGRQEFSDGPRQLVSLSDGPNLHRSWNGIRLHAHAPRYRIGAFELRATRLGSGAFDDGIQPDTLLRGINASVIVSPGEGPNTYLDPFWYHTEIPGFRFGSETGADRRDTHGLRLWGRKGALRWDWTIARQTGRTVGDRGIDAWGLFAVQSLSLSETGWKPRLTSHIDIASGDARPADGTLETFHPLYASSNYLGESQFLGLSNLMLVAPGLTFSPGGSTTVSLEYGYARRLDTRDAAYAGGMRPYAGTQAVPGRHIGNLARLNANWTPSDWLSLNFNLEQLSAARVLKAAGFHDGTQVQLTATYRY